MRTSISPLQLFTSVLIGTVNTIAAIYVSFLLKLGVAFFITMWAYYANSLYLLIVMICDISFYCKSTRLEHINTFFRKQYSIISMPYSYFVSFAFWLLVCFGPHVMTLKPSFWFKVLAVYLHGINTLFVIIDLKIAKHYKVNFSSKHIKALLKVWLCYACVLLFSRYVVKFNPYPFMNLFGLLILLLIGVGMFGIIVMCYCVHVFLTRNFPEELKETKSQ